LIVDHSATGIGVANLRTNPSYACVVRSSKFTGSRAPLTTAIARGLDGSTAVSAVVPFRVRAR
jgi:hypothetical protein